MFYNFEHFHFLFSNKMLVIRARIHKMLVEYQTGKTLSLEAVCSGSSLFVYAFLAGNF